MHVRTPAELGAALRDRRTRLRLGQAALAERVGVSRQWIVAVEGGKPHADMGLVLRTLDALGLRLDVEDADAGAAPAASIVAIPDIDAIVDAARQAAPPAPAPPATARPSAKRRAGRRR